MHLERFGNGWLGILMVGLSLYGASSALLRAQDSGEVEALRKQLREMQENFARIQRQQQEQIESLSKQLEGLVQKQTAEAEKRKLEAELAAEMKSTEPPKQSAPVSAGTNTPWSPANPIRMQRGGAYMDIGLIGTFAVGGSTSDQISGGTELGGHDPYQRGFNVQSVEASFAGAVDPYFRASANLAFTMNDENETSVELEEAWMETISLPGNFQVRAGQLMTDFGRINPLHPHAWAFVDDPIVNARLLGPDGLRNPGARVSWLAPTPFYSELFLTMQDSQGETAASFRGESEEPDYVSSRQDLPMAYRFTSNDRGVKHFSNFMFVPRYALSFDLSDTQVLLGGISAAFGPNSSGDPDAGDTSTQIYGLDLFWKWKPTTHHGGFPFVSFQTEAFLRRYEAGRFSWDIDGSGVAEPGEVVDDLTGMPALLKGEPLLDWGLYSQVLWGFRKGWVAGLRVDYSDGDTADYERLPLSLNGERLATDLQRSLRWRLSPNLTWYPTEFSKVRLQYNLDHGKDFPTASSIWLQFEFLLGAHAAHKF